MVMKWQGVLTIALLTVIGAIGLCQQGGHKQQGEVPYREYGTTEEEVKQNLARMHPKDRAFLELFWMARKVWRKDEPKGKLTDYCRRELRPEEKELIEKLIAFAKQHENDWVDGNYRGYRAKAIMILADHPHVCMIDALRELAWSPPLKDERPWRYRLNVQIECEVNTEAVIALHRIADERVIPILIELLEHPGGKVRCNVELCLGKLLGVWFRAKAWERLEEMRKRGKLTNEEYVKMYVRERENMENWREVKAMYERWWQENKGKVKIHWGAAWRSH
ncbi:MAG: hypothetical protein LKKZDAJK_002288 [Candidatus Fervidibacter sp.]